MNRLSADSIHLSYNDMTVVTDVSLSMSSGEFIGLVGSNGSGKTTLLSALSGQFQPDCGEIFYNDLNIYQDNYKYKSRIGVVHEEPYFYPFLTASDFLRFIASIKLIPAISRYAEILRVLRITQLESQGDRLTSELSLGMKKRLALASAILGKPQILFLDEPFVNVDYKSTHALKRYLQEFTRKGGIILLSTHILELVEKVCDKLILLQEGRIVKNITIAEFEAAKKKKSSDLEDFIINLTVEETEP